MSVDFKKFNEIIQNPELLNATTVDYLQNIVQDYPYLQSAKALLLKNLFQQNSPRYNHWLKITAAYTCDRGLLFDFITSDEFQTMPLKSLNKNEEHNFSENVVAAVVENLNQENENTKTEAIEDKLSIGKPIVFDKTEQHSFEEWLQLTKVKPIDRSKNKIEIKSKEIEVIQPEIINPIDDKISIIEKFINENPKIKPTKGNINPINFKVEPQDSSNLMTETLARVYLEQKKYQKAIQAYEILILKYPEKSYLFADRIKDIKILQQNIT